MPKFSLEYNHSKSYDEKIAIDIRLNVRPSQEDYKLMLDALDTLNKMRKYIVLEETKDQK